MKTFLELMIRHVLTGLSGALTLWLAEKGFDADNINDLATALIAGGMALFGIVWSVMNKKKHKKEIELTRKGLNE